ncbi:efflux RND transporter periplasmic adaptor subunit [Roseibacillus persicicus]|uniref:efflux RND transporter periplasmic adaptor subunit n=1 Tax=Roseibacillus persicicus TaxID=454148 RepID=UPI00280F120F|nr:efflux RND transporter periplasmic adaptor subunit [Roseibacillus persicicus]MDQ8192624.1 efflux RND transporter periplasmic adaptor subunit [Roseibacillus persicicus]
MKVSSLFPNSIPASRTLGLLVMPLSLLLLSCQEEQETAVEKTPRPVKVAVVHEGGLPKVVEFPGRIEPVQKAWKAFEVTGRIVELPVKEGQEVQKGEVLARLDARDFQSARDSARASYEAAQSVTERFRALIEKKAISQQEVDLAKRDLLTARANFERAEKALQDTVMVADFDGQVAEIRVEDFANVTAKQEILLIQDTSELEVAIQVPEQMLTVPVPGETDAEKVASTNPVVVVSSLPGQEFPARFSEFSERADPVTRTYEATLVFSPGEDSLLQPGMTAKVRAAIPANTVSGSVGFPVPLGAVFSREDGQSRVWRLDPETSLVGGVEVTPGAIVEGQMVVSGPLKDGDIVVTSGVHRLSEGDEVRVWKEQ